MEISWPISSNHAEKLYILLTNRIAIEFDEFDEFKCDPVKITDMYINGDQWQSMSDDCKEALWTHIETIGITNFDNISAIKARFILSLLPREDETDQQNRLDWLLEFSRRLGIPSDKIQKYITETLKAFSGTHNT